MEKSKLILKKQIKEKGAVIEQLRKTPILQVACERAGVPRATFYRWRKTDKEFSAAIEAALNQGSDLINDLAESQLLSAIKDRNLTAIIFWLRNHHQIYADKLKISGDISARIDVLTPEQEKSIKRALMLASLAIKKGKRNVKNKM